MKLALLSAKANLKSTTFNQDENGQIMHNNAQFAEKEYRPKGDCTQIKKSTTLKVTVFEPRKKYRPKVDLIYQDKWYRHKGEYTKSSQDVQT